MTCKHGFLALLVAGTLTLGLLGCFDKETPPAESTRQSSTLTTALRDIGQAPAALAVSEPMRPFFAAGLGFIVLGGLAICFGGKGSGFALMALGLGTTATGVLFVQYPWAVLLLALAAGVVAFIAIVDRLRARRELANSRQALTAAAEVIQKVPEGAAIKKGLAALGEKTEAAVRAAITPIKEQLRKEGKI